MTQSVYTNWADTWTATSIAASSITNTGTATTAAISNDGKSGTEIGVTIAYGSTADAGVDVYVLREVDGNYETVNDRPYGFQMPYAISTTKYRTFTVMADRVSKFKIYIENQTGATVTATISYKQATIEIN